MTVNEKIKMLRESMKKNGVNALVIPSSDPHMSEYLPEHWKARNHFSGFTGSAGTLVVTETESGLWTDGRYFVQAAKELEGSEIVLYRMGVKGVPTIPNFLAEKLNGKVLGIDGSVTSLALYKQYEKALNEVNATIKSVPCISECWENRPEIPASKVFLHELKYTGLTAAQKITALRDELKKSKADAIVVSSLTSIIWLLNIRASDVEMNPYPVSFCMVTSDETALFINKSRVPADVVENLKENGVALYDYNEIIKFVSSYNKKQTILVDEAVTSFDVFNSIKANNNFSIEYGSDPIILMKAIKSKTEIANIKNAHIKDGASLVRFQIKLEKMMAEGKKITEVDISDMVLAERSKEQGFVSASFSTIAAYGANAAMMHYKPTPEKCATLENHGYLLVDNGGHYLDGTTDTTRTYALGKLTDNEKEYYTLVLKSNVDLAMVVFMEGAAGTNIDIIARNVLWQKGLDYRCGTGHGVGYLGGIHEGPQSMRKGNTVPFVPGMVITDEPGIYEENEVGIRIENELVCIDYMETEYGKFFAFEPITYCPIDLTPVVPSMLNKEEIEWIDNYHKLVFEKLSPVLTADEQAWLKNKTLPLAEQAK